MEKNTLNILVCIFHYEERSLLLNKYCWEKLGLKNIYIFSSKSKLHEKLNELADYVYNNNEKYDLIIKSDADEFVFDGIYELIEKSKNYDITHGYFFDKFMNRWRGGGPKIYKPHIFEKIYNKELLIKDVNKPESQLITDVKNIGLKFNAFNIKTILHEYEQYPSKVLNALINRYHRGHLISEYLYSKNFLMSKNIEKEYNDVIKYLYNNYIPKTNIHSKKNCHYLDYSNFDNGIKPIQENEIPLLYEKYLKLYKSLIKNH